MFSFKMLGFLFILSTSSLLDSKNDIKELQVIYNTESYRPIDIKDKVVFNAWTKAINSTIKSK